MARAARILVIGEQLPFREELLEHREIETRWATSSAEVVTHLRERKMDACVVSPGFTDRNVIWLVRRSIGDAPVIVLVDDPEEKQDWPPEAAHAVVLTDEVESLVLLLAQHTGLRLARHPRADIAAPVMVAIQGRVYELVTQDLSLSGVAIPGFPRAPSGTRVELVITLCGRSVHARARVVRRQEAGGRCTAGLTFIDLAEGPRSVIHHAVQSALGRLPQQWEIDELFGDLGLGPDEHGRALSTRDVSASPLPAFVPRTADLEFATIRGLLDENDTGPIHEAPEWLIQVTRDLTTIERDAVMGNEGPAWALEALKLRVNLARVRDRFPDRPPPSALIDDAYRMFERLQRETQDAPAVVLRQARRIRACLLREMVSPPRTDDMPANSDAPGRKAG